MPVSLGKSVDAYMEELRDKLETAANFVNDHAQRAQASYTAHYNLTARDKRFHVGDQVLLYWHPRSVISSGINGKACDGGKGETTSQLSY